jgi:hypothetical protein
MTYPANYSLNQHVRHVLYALKRQYGGTITIYQNGTVTTNAKTGSVTRIKTSTRIVRAVILPVTISREVKQSISLISANKQTVTGGNFEAGKRLFIVERRDCPTLVLQLSDWITFDNRKYAIENIEEYEFDAAYVIKGKELPGEPSGGGGISGTVTDNVTLNGGAGGVL